MKTLLLLAALGLSSTHTYAVTACQLIYRDAAELNIDKKVKIQKHRKLGYGATVLGFFINPLLGGGMLLAQGSSDVYTTRKPDERKALDLAELNNSALLEFTEELQSTLDERITLHEIYDIVQAGFDSGKFCERNPDLYKEREVKRYVKNILRTKYF